MAEYIEREAAINVCSNQYIECLRKSDWCGDTVAWNIGFAIKAIPAADVAPVAELRAMLSNLENKCCGDGTETYTTGYRNGHRNGQIELLRYILQVPDGTSEDNRKDGG